jgi:hypothetical protein
MPTDHPNKQDVMPKRRVVDLIGAPRRTHWRSSASPVSLKYKSCL